MEAWGQTRGAEAAKMKSYLIPLPLQFCSPVLLQYAAGLSSKDDAHGSCPAPCSSRKPSGKPRRLPFKNHEVRSK